MEKRKSIGIKDMEGNSVHEGDILKISYGIPPTIDTLIVTWDTEISGWWFKNVKPDGCSTHAGKEYSDDIEVIGNIYENPELLEKDNKR